MWSSYWDSVAVFLGINVLMGISLYVPMTAGLISLGQGAFMAIGAYVCALLTKANHTEADLPEAELAAIRALVPRT